MKSDIEIWCGVMKICASLSCPEDFRNPEIDLSGADMIEIRLDLFRKSGFFENHSLSEFLSELKIAGFSEERILIAFHSEKPDMDLIPDDFSGFVDVGEPEIESELTSGLRSKIGSETNSEAGIYGNISLIKSFHDFEKTPSAYEICTMLKNMRENSDESKNICVPNSAFPILKGAFAASSLSDLRSIADASVLLSAEMIPHILIAMNPIGTVTRIRSSLLSNEFTFAAAGDATASGQLSVSEMKFLGDDCVVTGLLGHPLGHSSSPAMHCAAFESCGVPGKYLLFDVPSSDDLENLPDFMRFYNICGLNVTIPYKSAVIPYLDELDDAASKIGAVNTIINVEISEKSEIFGKSGSEKPEISDKSGKLVGSNTDYIGIRCAFENAGIDLCGKSVLVFGSGGAARACLYLLSLYAEYGTKTTVVGRNEKTVRQVSSDFKTLGIIISNSSDAVPSDSVSLESFDVIINATPVGMNPDIPAIYPFDLSELRQRHVVFDMVYNVKTPLVSAAEHAGCVVVSGKDMLAGQGAASFEMWTGKKVSVDVMRREIL